MKKVLLFVLIVFIGIANSNAQITWTGSGGDGLWATAANWSGGAVPISTDIVLLDNSTVSGSYTVTLPTASAVTITKLTITPSGANNITLVLPSGNTQNPGFTVGDATASTDDIIINNGGILKNSSGASAGNGIALNSSANGTLRINNGGRYVHNTNRSAGGVLTTSGISTVSGTETGIFEYDVPGTSSFGITASNRTYGTLMVTLSSGSHTYTTSGGSPLTINGDIVINSGVTFSSGMTGTANVIKGNISVGAGSTLNFNGAAGVTTLSGSSAQTVSNSGTITVASGTTLAIANTSGVSLSGANTTTISGTLNVSSGTLTTNGNLTVASGGVISAASYPNISGNVTLQQTFVGQRGWRVLANPFTTAQTIATVATNNGITIGTTAAASGLTDSRTLDNSTNTWTNVTGTTWAANTPYGLFYRGKSTEVSGTNYTGGPSAITYSVGGTLNGASTSIPAPSSTSNFMLVGNPYAAPVSSSALTNGAGASYYVYQISVNGDGRTAAGGWSAQLSSSTSATIPVLGVIAYKPSASGYNIATTDINTGGTIQTGLFGAETVIKNLELVVNKDGVFQDKMFLRLDANSTEKGTDSKDLSKFYNDDVNFYTITKDNNRLAIDARKDFNSNIPLGINGTAGNYVLNVANNNLENITVYLKDKLNNTQTELTPATNYNFSITADAATKGEGRFELQFVSKAMATLPTNNTSGGFTAKVLGNVITNNQPIQVQVQNASANAVIQVKDVNGRAIATQAAVNGLNTINVSRASLGLYIVQTTDGNNIVTDKVIKQ